MRQRSHCAGSFRTAALGRGVFVGSQTLEVDLLPLVGNELIAAFDELLSGSKRAANMARDVAALMEVEKAASLLKARATTLVAAADAEEPGKSTHGDRIARVLGRIEDLGKGRSGQRLADHVDSIDLRQRVVDLLKARGVPITQGVVDSEESVTVKLLREAGNPGAMLRILNWASHMARQRHLFDVEE